MDKIETHYFFLYLFMKTTDHNSNFMNQYSIVEAYKYKLGDEQRKKVLKLRLTCSKHALRHNNRSLRKWVLSGGVPDIMRVDADDVGAVICPSVKRRRKSRRGKRVSDGSRLRSKIRKVHMAKAKLASTSNRFVVHGVKCHARYNEFCAKCTNTRRFLRFEYEYPDRVGGVPKNSYRYCAVCAKCVLTPQSKQQLTTPWCCSTRCWNLRKKKRT